MKIPGEVKILGMTYQIEEVEYISRTEDLLGQIDESNLIIKLRADIPEQLKEQTLIHELVHSIFANIGRLDLYGDEVLVTSFANTLHQIISDNESLFL